MGSVSLLIKSYFKGTRLGTYLRRRRWNAAVLSRENVQKTVEKFMPNACLEEKDMLIADILDMAKKYRFSAEEYFCYHFKDKPEVSRKIFISDLNRIDVVESMNQARNLSIFDDKTRTVKYFGKYYCRDTCGVTSSKDLEKLVRFAQTHNRFILKPLFGTCGRGIQVVDLSQMQDPVPCLKQLIHDYCDKGRDGFIAEELIVQVPELAKFHPSSVNTIRVATVRFEEGVEVIASFFRTGRGNSVVDNVGSGGVFGNLDLASGTITAVSDEYGNSYTNHPDTGEQMVGFVMPRWDEAKALAKELATVVPGNRYAGWDLALTKDGWVLVEANARGQFVWQIPSQQGFMPETNRILKRLGIAEITDPGIK